ncbi:hypothetical protein D9M73_192930 [compost metagenome]
MRLAPPLSARVTTGSLFSKAICCMRRDFFRPVGEMVPPLIALLLAITRQRMPAM